jgi:hypothetical protein
LFVHFPKLKAPLGPLAPSDRDIEELFHIKHRYQKQSVVLAARERDVAKARLKQSLQPALRTWFHLF